MYQPDPVAEQEEIQKKYRHLCRVWKPRQQEDRKIVYKAYKMALEAHKDMRRKTGEPYIYHPLSVAIIAVEEIGLGTTSVICALLHDVVEDTEYTIEDIRGLFGDKVAAIIDGLTKIKGIFDKRTSLIHAENFRKILLTLSDDVRVILIKLADRLHNMRTLDALSHEKQVKISSETTYLYAPLAHRLGLHQIKSELEDLALKYTEPDIYNMISKRIRETARDREKFVKKFIKPIHGALEAKKFRFNIVDRQKSIAAIWQKMKKKEVPLEEIYDIYAIRIVIESPIDMEKAECWKVYSCITEIYKPNMERLRDWISIPKANGYEALHTTVMSQTGEWVEIQIRSKRMDEIAEKGYAAHWKYKESFNLNSRLDNWLDRIREMITNPNSDALSFIEDVKGFFFLDEITVFTPQGELRSLPAGSSVLDFAYAIHTELGNTCIGAKVDKKLVPINQTLQNGQQVEIITSRKQTPKDEWLRYAVTTRAKSNIKLSLRKEKRRFSKQGREKIGKWFHQFDIPFNHEYVKKFLVFCRYTSLIDLYFAAARDVIGPKDVKSFAAESYQQGWLKFISKDKRPLPKTADPAEPPAAVQHHVRRHDVHDTAKPGVKYEQATCCNPIPGDEVIGLADSGQQVVQIHRSLCLRAQELIARFGSKMVPVSWTMAPDTAFTVEIKISGLDKKGLISEITRVISIELNINIKSFTIDASDGLTSGSVVLYIDHVKHLKEAMDKLMGIEGIRRVVRVD